MSEWKPAENASPGMKSFLEETHALWEDMNKEEKPPEESKEEAKPPEEAKPAEPPAEPPAEEPAKPLIAEPSTPKEQTGFIKDWDKAGPEDYKKRIAYLYAKDKENQRQWQEAREILRKNQEEVERVRSETAKYRIQQSETALDQMQLQVVDLLDRNSPNYNPQEGARLLRELTNRDVAIKGEKEAEQKRTEEFKQKLQEDEAKRNEVEAKAIFDNWADTRDYAKPGHPMFQEVVDWLRMAYQKAPPEVTVEQIVQRAEQIFDAKIAEKKPTAPGANGEKLTVSSVLGTKPTPGQPRTKVDSLSPRQREIAEKLFLSPERGINKSKAYELYAQGLE